MGNKDNLDIGRIANNSPRRQNCYLVCSVTKFHIFISQMNRDREVTLTHHHRCKFSADWCSHHTPPERLNLLLVSRPLHFHAQDVINALSIFVSDSCPCTFMPMVSLMLYSSSCCLISAPRNFMHRMSLILCPTSCLILSPCTFMHRVSLMLCLSSCLIPAPYTFMPRMSLILCVHLHVGWSYLFF